LKILDSEDINSHMTQWGATKSLVLARAMVIWTDRLLAYAAGETIDTVLHGAFREENNITHD